MWLEVLLVGFPLAFVSSAGENAGDGKLVWASTTAATNRFVKKVLRDRWCSRRQRRRRQSARRPVKQVWLDGAPPLPPRLRWAHLVTYIVARLYGCSCRAFAPCSFRWISSHPAVFFSRNKSANSIFSNNKPAKRTGWLDGGWGLSHAVQDSLVSEARLTYQKSSFLRGQASTSAASMQTGHVSETADARMQWTKAAFSSRKEIF
jgi:hypothetical protein